MSVESEAHHTLLESRNISEKLKSESSMSKILVVHACAARNHYRAVRRGDSVRNCGTYKWLRLGQQQTPPKGCCADCGLKPDFSPTACIKLTVLTHGRQAVTGLICGSDHCNSEHFPSPAPISFSTQTLLRIRCRLLGGIHSLFVARETYLAQYSHLRQMPIL